MPYEPCTRQELKAIRVSQGFDLTPVELDYIQAANILGEGASLQDFVDLTGYTKGQLITAAVMLKAKGLVS